MPPIEWGRTAPVIISQRVAPSARAPSRSVCGVVSITSRDTDDTIGVIMTARISAAVRNVRPPDTGPKIRPSTGQSPNHPWIVA